MTVDVFVSLFWLLRILANVLTYISLWYVKEYRFDRMFIHLQTSQGRRLLFMPFRRPPLSPKSIVIAAGSAFVLILGYFVIPYPLLFKLLLLDVLTFPVTALFVSLTKIPTHFYHAYKISKAVRLIRSHAPMHVIAITGSYGKTSTKELLSTMLGVKYKTLKTDGSKNSPIAIAELICTKLQPDHEVFVVEMGAYKRGEIAEMCKMVRPEISIVTAINAQHQDLFGSIENTVKAKYEIVEGLSENGVAIFNADNENTRKMGLKAEKSGKTVRYYSSENFETSKNLDLHLGGEIQVSEVGISFDVTRDGVTKSVSVPLLGKHHVSNMFAAMTAALSVGMTFDEVVASCKLIRPFDKTMQRIDGINSATFIDDTFNNNPDAAIAAIDYLSELKPKRILVFQPMIELGEYAVESHVRVGEAAGKKCDEVILTNDSYADAFIRGVKSARKGTKVSILSGKNGAMYIKKQLNRGDTVLFKGKEASKILRYLVSSAYPMQ